MTLGWSLIGSPIDWEYILPDSLTERVAPGDGRAWDFKSLWGEWGENERRPEAIRLSVRVSMEAVYLGSRLSVDPGPIQKVCPHCRGTGAHEGSEKHIHKCKKCGGSGQVSE